MIYLDTSVALAHLLGETRAPRTSLWDESLVSSRLLEYEIWVRLHAGGFADSHGDGVSTLLGVVDLLELSPPVLVRALRPFPVDVRTLDALHLASALRTGAGTTVLTFDLRQAQAARTLGLAVVGS